MDRLIYLTQGKVAVVDDIDWMYLLDRSWQAHKSKDKKTWYVWRSDRIDGIKITVQMHTVIIERMGLIVPKGYVIDHKDHDGLNNRRNNLRVITYSESCINQGRRKNSNNKYRGVTKLGHLHFKIRIQCNNQEMYFEVYATEEDAAKMRDELTKLYHGEFVVLNFPGE